MLYECYFTNTQIFGQSDLIWISSVTVRHLSDHKKKSGVDLETSYI